MQKKNSSWSPNHDTPASGFGGPGNRNLLSFQQFCYFPPLLPANPLVSSDLFGNNVGSIIVGRFVWFWFCNLISIFFLHLHVSGKQFLHGAENTQNVAKERPKSRSKKNSSKLPKMTKFDVGLQLCDKLRKWLKVCQKWPKLAKMIVKRRAKNLQNWPTTAKSSQEWPNITKTAQGGHITQSVANFCRPGVQPPGRRWNGCFSDPSGRRQLVIGEGGGGAWKSRASSKWRCLIGVPSAAKFSPHIDSDGRLPHQPSPQPKDGVHHTMCTVPHIMHTMLLSMPFFKKK